jgi:protein PsiE
MQINDPRFNQINRFFSAGLNIVEYFGLLVIGFATTIAIFQEVMVMIGLRTVRLADLLLMFLYLEVLAMIGQYFRTGQLPVRFPLYIAMVALARYIILELKEMSEWKLLAVSFSIVLLTAAVLVVRYGHLKLPYVEDHDGGKK